MLFRWWGGGGGAAFQMKWGRCFWRFLLLFFWGVCCFSDEVGSGGGVGGGGSVAFQMRWVCWMFFHGG